MPQTRTVQDTPLAAHITTTQHNHTRCTIKSTHECHCRAASCADTPVQHFGHNLTHSCVNTQYVSNGHCTCCAACSAAAAAAPNWSARWFSLAACRNDGTCVSATHQYVQSLPLQSLSACQPRQYSHEQGNTAESKRKQGSRKLQHCCTPFSGLHATTYPSMPCASATPNPHAVPDLYRKGKTGKERETHTHSQLQLPPAHAAHPLNAPVHTAMTHQHIAVSSSAQWGPMTKH
jgi:hypothetical protein